MYNICPRLHCTSTGCRHYRLHSELSECKGKYCEHRDKCIPIPDDYKEKIISIESRILKNNTNYQIAQTDEARKVCSNKKLKLETKKLILLLEIVHKA